MNCIAGTYRNLEMVTCADCGTNKVSGPGATVCTVCGAGSVANYNDTECGEFCRLSHRVKKTKEGLHI